MKRLFDRLGRGPTLALLAGAGMMATILLVSVSPARDTPSLDMPSRQPSPTPSAPPVLTPRALPAAKPIPVAAPKPADGPFVVRRILQIDKPLRHGDYYWDDAGVPSGPIVITVDLQAEVLSVFRGGYEIGTAVVNYGDEAYMTPLGTFPITQKDAHHVSNVYDAKMPYMLRLTNDGVTIHGAEVAWDHATHGCIAVPTPFAKLLFEQAHLGDRVIITRGKRMNLGDRITRG
jgi:hypothetical protein